LECLPGHGPWEADGLDGIVVNERPLKTEESHVVVRGLLIVAGMVQNVSNGDDLVAGLGCGGVVMISNVDHQRIPPGPGPGLSDAVSGGQDVVGGDDSASAEDPHVPAVQPDAPRELVDFGGDSSDDTTPVPVAACAGAVAE